MKKRRILLLMACFLFVMGMGNAYGWDLGWGGGIQYDKARYAVKHKRYDIALMEFRAVVKDFPGTAYARKSLFAMGEYYYNNSMFYDATSAFSECAKTWPASKEALFARAYLLNMTKDAGVESTKDKTFSKDASSILSKRKKLSYRSAFRNFFKMKLHQDKIEVYRNGAPFLEITK